MNDNSAVSSELIDPEIEAAPEASGLVATSRESVEDLYYLADNIEKMISAQNKIRLAVLKLAQPGDWVTFGKEDKEKAEIGFAGALRIGSTLGVSFTNWEAKKETGRDDRGEWYRWEYECDAIFRGRTIRVYGRGGSRDKFFGKDHGEFKEIHDIDEGNIKMASRRAAMKEGVKVLFGLHHMDPAHLRANGVKLESAGGYAFKNKDEKAAESDSVTVGIAEVTMKKGDGWTKYTVQDSEGALYGTFSESVATEAKNAKTTKAPALIIYKTTAKYGNEIISINGVSGNGK